jgi:hypothetical protein
VIRPDGVKCFVTRFRSAASCRPAAAATARLIATIPDDLSIPDFLRRPFEADGEAS